MLVDIKAREGAGGWGVQDRGKMMEKERKRREVEEAGGMDRGRKDGGRDGGREREGEREDGRG